MKKFSKSMILLLAALMLFASCESEPKTPDVPPAPAIKLKEEPKYNAPEELPLPDDSYKPTKMEDINPAHPYTSLHYGLFDNQTFTTKKTFIDGKNDTTKTTIRYSIFIPETGQPKIPAIIIFTPNDTTAAEFARTEIGKSWIEQANSTGDFAVVFAEPFNGGKWNLDLKPSTEDTYYRNERIAGLNIFVSLREKEISEEKAYLNVDKNGITLAGYGEGASMAAILAASWPQTFANCICVDPKGFDNEVATKVIDILKSPTSPHNSDWNNNYGNILAGQIAMPMYVTTTKGETGTEQEIFNSSENILKIWKGINANALREDTSNDLQFYTAKIVDDKTPKALSKLALQNIKPRGYRGGTLRARTDMWNDYGYEMHEEAIVEGDDHIRRWAIYTPKSVTAESNDVPVVMVLHGWTAAINDIVDESKWSDVADDNGFIVAYCQGYPVPDNDIHAPHWAQDENDIKFLLAVIDDIAETYDIDRTRVYLTGHSMGSMMTSTVMGSTSADKFAAFGPIGSFPSLPEEQTIPLAFWAMAGEWEFGGKKIEYNGKIIEMPGQDQKAEKFAARFKDLEKNGPEAEKNYTAEDRKSVV